MGRKISLSIDLSKVNKDWFVIGKTGTKYLALDVYENDQPDKYGNHWAAKQSAPKNIRAEMKQRGEKIPYCGNGKEWDRPAGPQSAPVQPLADLPSREIGEVPF